MGNAERFGLLRYRTGINDEWCGLLNLVVAGASGVLIPIALHEIGRNPAHGSSVLVTFMTDAMGFFLLLGLASWFLI